MKENIVEIKGGKYRYAYDPETQDTVYRGPVGDAPALDIGEFEEFMKTYKSKVYTAQEVYKNPELIGNLPSPGWFFQGTIRPDSPVKDGPTTVRWTLLPKEMFDEDTFRARSAYRLMKVGLIHTDEFGMPATYHSQPQAVKNLLTLPPRGEEDFDPARHGWGLSEKDAERIVIDILKSDWPNSLYTVGRNTITGDYEIQALARRKDRFPKEMKEDYLKMAREAKKLSERMEQMEKMAEQLAYTVEHQGDKP
jgi:hypothetical protein